MPKVSVIIPNYNHALFLEQRIETVIQQTFKNIEILILDDCSIDNSREIIEKYAALDSRIKIIFNEKNSGSTFKQWNKGFSLASGDFIWIAESDDYSDLSFLERGMEVMVNNEEVSIVYSNSHIVNSENEILNSYQDWVKGVSVHKWLKDYINTGKEETLDYLMYRNTIPNASSVLIRHSAYERSGGANENMKLCGDWLMYLQMLRQGDIAYISDPLNYYRVHNQTIRRKYFYNIEGFEEIMQVFQQVMEAYELKKEDIHKDKFAYITSVWLQSLSNAGMNREIVKRHFKYYVFLKDLDTGLDKKILKLYFKKVMSFLKR